MKSILDKVVSQRYVRLLLVLVAVMGCVWLMKLSASYGVSRLLTRSALALQNLAVAQAATSMTPADPQAHRTNAALLSQFDQPSESIVALEQAIALRPRDYSLWLVLCVSYHADFCTGPDIPSTGLRRAAFIHVRRASTAGHPGKSDH